MTENWSKIRQFQSYLVYVRYRALATTFTPAFHHKFTIT